MGFNILLCLTIIVLYFLTHIQKTNRQFNDKVFLIISFIILFILVALRETNIGNDTIEYIKLFENCAKYKWDLLNTSSRFEAGYTIFNIILSYISSSTRFFMIIMSLIVNYSVYKFLKSNSKNYLFSIIIYINLLFFYQSMTMIRQCLAMSIILLAFKYVKEKQLFKYILMVILASCFHITAIVGILIYPIYHLKINKKRILLLTIATIIISILLEWILPSISVITNRFNYYDLQVGEAKLANIILFLIYLVFTVFAAFIVINNNKKKDNSSNDFYIYVFIISAILYAISINAPILARIGHYIAIYSIIAIPNIIYQNINKKILLYELIISLFLISYSSTIMVFRPEWNSAYNYKIDLTGLNENQGEY